MIFDDVDDIFGCVGGWVICVSVVGEFEWFLWLYG